MDFTDIDNLITKLEKKKNLRPGSPMVVFKGYEGIWRMIRHHRVFLELLPSVGGGKRKAGRILVGPPSMVGYKLDKIPSSVWEKLTPRSTLKEFKNVKVADNGVATLKESIKNAVNETDTRIDALKSLNTPTQLVPIARSAGFTDDEIKQALGGTAPNKPLKGPNTPAAPDAPEKPEAPEAPEKPDAPKDEAPPKKPVDILMPPGSKAPEPDTRPGPDKAAIDSADKFIEGTLALAQDPDARDDEDKAKGAKKFLTDRLEEAFESGKLDSKGDIYRKQMEKIIAGLKTGDYSLADALPRISEINRDNAKLKENVPTDQQLDQLKDRAEVKQLIESFDARVQEKVDEAVEAAGKQLRPETSDESESDTEGLPEELRQIIEEGRKDAEQMKREAEAERRKTEAARQEAQDARRQAQEAMSAAELDRLNVEAAVALLMELAAKIKNPEVKKQVQELASNLKTSPFNKRSIFLRLYQLFQLLLLFIPL